MAILAIPSGLSEGTPFTVSLNKSELFSLASIASNPHFSNQANIATCLIKYEGDVAGALLDQTSLMRFDLAQENPSCTVGVSSGAADLFLISQVILIDHEGAVFSVPVSEVPALDLDFSGSGSGGGEPPAPTITLINATLNGSSYEISWTGTGLSNKSVSIQRFVPLMGDYTNQYLVQDASLGFLSVVASEIIPGVNYRLVLWETPYSTLLASSEWLPDLSNGSGGSSGNGLVEALDSNYSVNYTNFNYMYDNSSYVVGFGGQGSNPTQIDNEYASMTVQYSATGPEGVSLYDAVYGTLLYETQGGVYAPYFLEPSFESNDTSVTVDVTFIRNSLGKEPSGKNHKIALRDRNTNNVLAYSQSFLIEGLEGIKFVSANEGSQTQITANVYDSDPLSQVKLYFSGFTDLNQMGNLIGGPGDNWIEVATLGTAGGSLVLDTAAALNNNYVPGGIYALVMVNPQNGAKISSQWFKLNHEPRTVSIEWAASNPMIFGTGPYGDTISFSFNLQLQPEGYPGYQYAYGDILLLGPGGTYALPYGSFSVTPGNQTVTVETWQLGNGSAQMPLPSGNYQLQINIMGDMFTISDLTSGSAAYTAPES